MLSHMSKPRHTSAQRRRQTNKWTDEQTYKCIRIYMVSKTRQQACLEERCIVQNNLWSGDSELHDSIVCSPSRLWSAETLLKVAVEGPQLEAAVQAPLHRTLPLSCSHSLHMTHGSWDGVRLCVGGAGQGDSRSQRLGGGSPLRACPCQGLPSHRACPCMGPALT